MDLSVPSSTTACAQQHTRGVFTNAPALLNLPPDAAVWTTHANARQRRQSYQGIAAAGSLM
jgi:hypothetical protein